jgi:hypothetical protein
MASQDDKEEHREPKDRPLVQMVVQLKPNKSSGELRSADESADLAHQVLMRVAGEIGRPAARINVLGNLATVLVEADGEFQAVLARQPEVVSATPNQSTEAYAIPPVRKPPASR